MSPLRNPRHEQFAQLVAGGKSATESYILAGFSEKGAAQSANRLREKADVGARIAELREAVSAAAITRAAIDRDFVLGGLKTIAIDRECSDTSRVRALELCGKELGMFQEKKPDDGPRPTEVVYRWQSLSESSNTHHGQASNGSTNLADDSRVIPVQ